MSRPRTWRVTWKQGTETRTTNVLARSCRDALRVFKETGRSGADRGPFRVVHLERLHPNPNTGGGA